MARVLLGIALLGGCGGHAAKIVDGGPGSTDGGPVSHDMAFAGAGVTVTPSFIAPEQAASGASPLVTDGPTFALVTPGGTVSARPDGTFPVSVGTTAMVLTDGSTDYLPTLGPSFVVAAENSVPAYVLEKDGKAAATPLLSAAGGPTQVDEVIDGACVVSVLSSMGTGAAAVVTLTATDADVYSIAYDQSGTATATKTTSGAASGLFVVYSPTHATSITMQATGGHSYAPLTCATTPGAVTFAYYVPAA